jgi:hypothetical protein
MQCNNVCTLSPHHVNLQRRESAIKLGIKNEKYDKDRRFFRPDFRRPNCLRQSEYNPQSISAAALAEVGTRNEEQDCQSATMIAKNWVNTAPSPETGDARYLELKSRHHCRNQGTIDSTLNLSKLLPGDIIEIYDFANPHAKDFYHAFVYMGGGKAFSKNGWGAIYKIDDAETILSEYQLPASLCDPGHKIPKGKNLDSCMEVSYLRCDL